jgi:hypothetical protein
VAVRGAVLWKKFHVPPYDQRVKLLFRDVFYVRVCWLKVPFLQKMSIIHRPKGCANRQGLIVSGSRSELYRCDKM